jgi:predicted tellurium resistance membrane protein TerC
MEKNMLSKIIEKVKDRDLSLGTIMIIAGILVWFGIAKFVGIGLVIYGAIQIFWKKEEQIKEVHQHHHHHNNNKKPRKKNA